MGDNLFYHGIDPSTAHVESLNGGADKDASSPELLYRLSDTGAPYVSMVSAGHRKVLAAPRALDEIIAELQAPGPALAAKAAHVDVILALHGKDERDPNDPRGRTYYAIAKNDQQAMVPSVLAPAGTPRAGLPYSFHSGLYVADLDCIPPGMPAADVLALIEAVLAALDEHPPVVAYGHSSSALAWVILAGLLAEDALAHRHYLAAILNGLPEIARQICSMSGQNNLDRLRYYYPDATARFRSDWTRAELPPPPGRLYVPGRPAHRQSEAIALPKSSRAGESAAERQAEMQAMLVENGEAPAALTPEGMTQERAKVRDALAAIPLPDNTGHTVWIKGGYALCAADVNWSGFGGRELFIEWTKANAHAGSTKPLRADAQYSELERTRETTLTIGPLYRLARAHGWKDTTGETNPDPETHQQPREPSGPSSGKKSQHRTGAKKGGNNYARRKVTLTQDEGQNVMVCVQTVRESNNPPSLFSLPERRGVCAWDGSGAEIIAPLETHLKVDQRIRFVRFNKGNKDGAVKEQDATPTTTLMKLVHIALRHDLPVLNGIKRIPFVWDGALVHQPGYHLPSGHLVDVPGDLEMGLSLADALRILEDYLGEFPYKTPADKTNALSVLLGAPLKTLGLGPGIFIDKPASQTGASLLARCIAWIMEGRPPAVVTQGKTTGEMDKRIITKVKRYPNVIIIDNITGVLESELVASGMTDETFGSRLLNLNEEAVIPTKSLTLMFTGNNFSATRDLLNRCLRCRLDADHPMPETRTGFRHVLPDDIVANRSILVSAAASIVQRWIEAGMPQGVPVLGSFAAYTAAVSGLMEFAGFQDFDGNRLKMLSEATPAWETLDSFVCAWWEKHTYEIMSSADLLPLATELDLKGYEDKDKAKSLSQKIGAARDKVYTIDETSTVKIREFGRDENGRAKRGVKYFLEPLE